jgi:hypothetical protein
MFCQQLFPRADPFHPLPPLLLFLQVASAPPQVPIKDDFYNSTCKVVRTPRLARCSSASDHDSTVPAAATASSSPHTATNSSAGEGPATSSRCSKKTVLHGSQMLAVSGIGWSGCE